MSETKSNVPAAPTREQFKPLNRVDNLQELFSHPEFKRRINEAASKHMDGERLLRTFVLAAQKQPKLVKVNPMSMMGIFITLAWLGLEPNTPLGYSHVLPFDVRKWNPATRTREVIRTDANMIIGYQGYLKLIGQSEQIQDLECDVVWDGDEFDYERGTRRHLHHKPKFRLRDPKEEPVAAYMYARLVNGGEIFHVMDRADVHNHRGRSQSFRSAMYAYDDAIKDGKDPMKNPAYAETPWVRDPIPMWRKSALRAGQVWLPKSVEIASALAIDEAADRGAADFSRVIDGSIVTDGGYEAIEEGVTLDAGAAFGLRGEREPEPVTTGTQTGQETQQQQPTQQQPAASQTQTDKPTATKPAARKAAPAAAKPQTAAQQQREPTPPADNEPPPPTGEHDYGGGTQAASAPAAGTGTTQVTQPATTAAAVPVDYYLVDEDSELVEGTDSHTQDPDVFAERFIGRWRKSSRPLSLKEANADFIADARRDSRDATDILAEIEREPEPAAEHDPNPAMDEPADEGDAGADDSAPVHESEPSRWYVEMPLNANNQPQFPGYVQAVRNRVKTMLTEADINESEAVNAETLATLPPATIAAVKRAHDGRRAELQGGGQAPAQVQQPEPAAPAATVQPSAPQPAVTQPAPAVDPDLKKAQDRIRDMNDCKTGDELTTFGSGTLVKILLDRFDRERPELSKMMREAAARRRQELEQEAQARRAGG